jgi:hemerythrin
MESQNDLNDNIRLTTIKIEEEHPELIKYINEIPRNFLFTTEKDVNNKALKEYLDSLNKILETYSKKY